MSSVVEPEYYECPGCGSMLKYRIKIQPSEIVRHEATRKHKVLQKKSSEKSSKKKSAYRSKWVKG